MAISVTYPSWKTEVKNSWETDPVVQQILTTLAANPSLLSNYTLIDGDLFRQGKLYVGAVGNLRQEIIKNPHGTQEGGHS